MVTFTILQAVIAVMLHSNNNLGAALQFFNINTRDGISYRGESTKGLEWVRGEDTEAYMKADKKGRLFVAQKYMTVVRWGITSSNKLYLKSGIIQMNVLKSNSKRGGWLIRFHVQTPVLARTKKFQFHGKWVGYWASDAMLEAGLMAKASNNKFGKAVLINEVFNYENVMQNINMLKGVLGEKIVVPELNMYDIEAHLAQAADEAY
jgi:hypothetical protein